MLQTKVDHVDLQIAALDWLGQGPIVLSGSAASDLKQVDFVKISKPFGRFGNNYYQAMHAIVIAKALGARRIIMPRFVAAQPVVHDPELALSISFDVAEEASPGNGLSGAFYAPYGFESIFVDQSHALLSQTVRIATDRMYPVCVGVSNSKTLAIHIRAGDIFTEGSQANWYVQPPASFYTKAIKHALASYSYEHCELVYEDRGNPAVDIVENYLRSIQVKFSSEPQDLLTDVRRLSSAHGLVCSFSSFAEAAALISRSIRAIYSFRSVSSQIDFAPFLQTRLAGVFLERGIDLYLVEDMPVTYIAPKTWTNSADQRAAIACYPESHLRLFAVTRDCA